MNLALGLFALSLLGAEGPQNREAPAIKYSVRVIKMNGLEWRGVFFEQLQLVKSQGGASLWTTSHETAQRLAELDPQGMMAPTVTAASQAVAHFSNRTNRNVTSGVTRLWVGPDDHATKVSYTPINEVVRQGFAITMSGRKLDQGVLACVVLDDTRVAAVHCVNLAEHTPGTACCDAECDKVAPHIQIPEIAHAALGGEWLIPNGGALVMSLGVQTTADPDGKAVIVERLVLLEADPVTDDAVRQASLSQPAPGVLPRIESAAAGRILIPLPMPMPAMPSRSLPQALAADGSPIPLPPLPAESHTPPSSLPGTSEPCASPQAPNRRQPEPTTLDSASSRAGFIESPKDMETKPEEGPGGYSRRDLLRSVLPLAQELLLFEEFLSQRRTGSPVPTCPACRSTPAP